MRLEREHPDHGLVVVPHVRAGRRAELRRDPPQPEEPDDVVDAQGTGVPQQGADHVAQGGVARPGERIGQPRRLVPVLPQLVVHVRRGSHEHALGVRVTQGPGIRPLRVHAHRKVVHDADAHPGVRRGCLRRAHLVVGDPLQPRVESHSLRELDPQPRDERRPDVPCLVRALLALGEPVGVVLLEGAPEREVRERTPLALARTRRARTASPASAAPRTRPRAPRAWPATPHHGRCGTHRCSTSTPSRAPARWRHGRRPRGTPPRGCLRDADRGARGSGGSRADTARARCAG